MVKVFSGYRRFNSGHSGDMLYIASYNSSYCTIGISLSYTISNT